MPSGSNLITALQPVRPGDLITARFVNGLISAILELEDRVSVLETEGRLVVPEEGGEPVQPIVIKAAVASQTETTLSFKVFGSGLEPSGLRTFMLNNRPFDAARLEGDDSRITFLLDRRRFDILGAVMAETSEIMMTRDSRDAGLSREAGIMTHASGIGGASMFMSRAASAASSAVTGIRDIEPMVEQPRNLVLTIVAKSGASASRRVEMV